MTKKFMAACCALAIAACTDADAPDDDRMILQAGQWDDGDRSGICVANGMDASFILYGSDGDANCSAQGKIDIGEEGGLVFAPRGDNACQIAVEADGETVRLTSQGEACDYYCGGDVQLTGQTLRRSEATGVALLDPAGDSIC